MTPRAWAVCRLDPFLHSCQTLLLCASGALEGFHAFCGAEQQQVSWACSEQAVGDHADDGVDLGFQLHGVGDRQVEHVEDDIAVVGHHAFAVHRIAAEFDQLAGDMATCHRYHFHRQWEGAEDWHQLAGVGDANKGLRHGRNDLLAGQGRATALDQVEVLVAFIGAIHIELQVADGVQLIHRDTMTLEACGGGFGTGHSAVELHLVLGQGIDKTVGSGAGADTDHTLGAEFGENKVDGSLGDGLLELILIHL